ncbi:unnamed protein product, partial [Rotaria sp. Silwood1]
MSQGKIINRFIDADKEPTKTLTPIEGYEKKDLVSVENAMVEIEPPIHNLKTMVWTAKRNSRNPLDGLTSDESASIHLYTLEWPEAHQSVYTLLNEKLRSEKRSELQSWYSYLKLFLTALYKLPSLKKTIWRGIHGNVMDLYQEDFIWWGISSCTETMKVMEKFVGRSGIRTLFMIECINGKAIKSHSFYKDENEILLMPGTYLRVIDKWSPANDLYIIHLQEETPPCQLVAPPFNQPSSENSFSFNKLTINKFNQLNDPDTCAQSYESKTTTLLSSPPTYKNQKLRQMIHENNDNSVLYLSNEQLTDNDMEIISYYLLRNNTTLTTLYLENNQIGDKGAQYLAEGLPKNITLLTLDLENNQIGDNGAQYLGEGLLRNATLTELYLDNNEIGYKGAQSLGEGLQKTTTLTTLDLRKNEISDKGAQHLGEAFKKNTTLTTLNLSHNNIGDKGAQSLGEGLQKNMTLTTLDLRNNQIGDKGAQYLGEELQQNI